MNKVLIKSRDDCKFCNDAKGFLQGMEIEFEEEYAPSGQVPQIYVGDNHIGGYTELIELSQSQEAWEKTFNG